MADTPVRTRYWQRFRTEHGWFLWFPDPRFCDHTNDNACPTCDHDGYYQAHVDAQEAR